MTLTVRLDLNEAYATLARTTGYIGAKQLDTDSGAYSRISLVDEDRKLLRRFWQESISQLCLALRRQISAESREADTYSITLSLSEAFDPCMAETLDRTIKAYMVQSIAARWLAITDREVSAEYTAQATATLDDVVRHAYSKRRPSRPVYSA